MRAIVLRSLAVIGTGGLVLAAVLYVASTVDARPPEVLEIGVTQPVADDAQLALITTSLEVVFSEPVQVDGAAAALRLEPAVEGAVSLSGSTLIFTPAERLELETRYTVTLAEGISDLAGNELAELPPPFEFETAGRPTLVEAVPQDGADEVAVDAPIELTFSTLMDTASVEAALRLRPWFGHELRWSGPLLEIVPVQPLRPGLAYEISIGTDAADVAGVTLAEPITMGFRTVAPGLAVDVLVPADGIDGIAPTSPIAIVFGRPIDPASVTNDLLSITPAVAGTLEVVRLPTDPASEDGAGSILRFTPSGPLPVNTTFDVELAPGLVSSAGGGLATLPAWSFTTGAPPAAISNQVTFISERAGVANVWAMNPDGTRKHQVSTELVPVLDYVVAPDGSSLVVADGRRLVYSRADGSDRRVLTDDGLLEFDPAYSPNGRLVAFARADAETGAGLGLWEWEIDGGDPTAIEMPRDLGADPDPTAQDGAALRAPRYAPDGQALAFVDLAGSVGLLELPSERLTLAPFVAAAPPRWLPGSGTVLLTGRRGEAPGGAPGFEAPVAPLAPGDEDAIFRLARSGTTVAATPFGDGSAVAAVASDGTIAYIDAGGSLWLATSPTTAASSPVVSGDRVLAAAFSPGEPAMVIVVGEVGERGAIELLELDTRRRMPRAPEGSLPRWLP